MQPKFIAKAKLTSQGQITLPIEARKDLKIDDESELYWYELNDCLILSKELVNQKELFSIILSGSNMKDKKKLKEEILNAF